ncbi:MAG: hypothetical protein GF329_21945 [Candidatus Lokiarchaeota archaeon]|nr:hypothetical protein [Candidatus Lokiarchaeota archaeon]
MIFRGCTNNRIKILVFLLVSILLFELIFINFLNIPYLNTQSRGYSYSKDKNQNEMDSLEIINNNSIGGTGNSLGSIIKSNATYIFDGLIEDSKINSEREFDFVADNNNWNITKNNFTVKDIRANKTEFIIEDYPSRFINGHPFLDLSVWMSIKIPVSCVLNEVNIFVQEINFTLPPAWQIKIYNASRDPTGFYLEPHQEISLVSEKAASDTSLDPDQRVAAHWEDFPCDNTNGNAILDIKNTYQDTHGNGYYFICIVLPRVRSQEDLRFIYFNSDENDQDNGFLWAGTDAIRNLVSGDLCLMVDISPINKHPKPSDIAAGIENLFRPDARIDIVENSSSNIAHYIYNTSTENLIVAQNFSLSQEGVLNNISVYLEFNNSHISNGVIFLGIIADNGYGFPNISQDNPIIEVGLYYIYKSGITDQWIEFEMYQQPRLPAGDYWWLISANTTTGQNITIKGDEDLNGNNAVALNGTLFGNNTIEWNEITYDYACRIGWHPGLDIIPFDDVTYPTKNYTIENQSSETCGYLRNLTGINDEYVMVAQNFTIPEHGAILNNITLKLNSSRNLIPLILLIFNDNGTKNGPSMEGGPIIDLLDYALINKNTYTFQFEYSNGLDAGNYWWGLLALPNTTDPANNVSIYGINDTFSENNAVALNTTFNVSHGVISTVQEIPFDYFCDIGWQAPPKGIWTNDTRLSPGGDEKNHYSIKTRWMGSVSFNLSVFNTIESTSRALTEYSFNNENENYVNWNLSLEIEVPSNFRETLINVSKPIDWKTIEVFNGTQLYSNYFTPTENKSVIIKNIDNGTWKIKARSNNYDGMINLYKEDDTDYVPTSEIKIYDELRINITAENQSSGIVKLGIFYPYPNNFTFYETEKSLNQDGNATFDWNPENDPLAIGGVYHIVSEWNNGTQISFQSCKLFISPTPTNLTVITNLSRFPYIDDSTQEIIIKFNDSIRGSKISNGIINATILGPKSKSLEWTNLYSITQNESKKGLYRIKIDTYGLPINDSYSLEIRADSPGYEKGIIHDLPLEVKPVPVELNPEVNKITQYIDEYINFKCSFKDTFHKKDIDWANLTYNIGNTSIQGFMNLAMPGESIYESGLVKLSGINVTGNRNYKINITANAANCSKASVLIDLQVNEKTSTSIVLNSDSKYKIPSEVVEGQSITLSVYLLNNSNNSGMPNETIKFSFAGKIPNRIAETDSDGMALVEFVVPSGISFLEVMIEYEGSIKSNQSRFETPITINVISTAAFIGRIVLWVVIGVAAVVSVVIAYKYLIIKPRKARRIKKLKNIANKFHDIANLRYLMVIHRDAGMSIFDYPISESEFDGTLISGFFTAIGAFQKELSKKKEEEGFELSYSNYKILVMNGELVQAALITESTASERIRLDLREFLNRFEQVYEKEIQEFSGNVKIFKAAGDLVRKTFDLYLTYPQVLTDKGKTYMSQVNQNKQVKELSKLEIAILKIIDNIMKTRGINYFFIPLAISMARAARPEQDLEIFGGIYNLIQKSIIEPIELQ